eukprot:2131991-Rhodomonas_salina.1
MLWQYLVDAADTAGLRRDSVAVVPRRTGALLFRAHAPKPHVSIAPRHVSVSRNHEIGSRERERHTHTHTHRLTAVWVPFLSTS